MYRLTLLIIAILILSTTINSQEAMSQDRFSANRAGAYGGMLPYVAMPNDVNTAPKQQEWKLVGPYPQPVSGEGYIQRPYHNPNLIEENENARALQQQQAQEAARAEAIRKQNQMARMCQFSFAARRARNGYMQGGPAVITPYKVYSREVVSQADYRNACTQYYRDNRYLSND